MVIGHHACTSQTPQNVFTFFTSGTERLREKGRKEGMKAGRKAGRQAGRQAE